MESLLHNLPLRQNVPVTQPTAVSNISRAFISTHPTFGGSIKARYNSGPGHYMRVLATLAVSMFLSVAVLQVRGDSVVASNCDPAPDGYYCEQLNSNGGLTSYSGARLEGGTLTEFDSTADAIDYACVKRVLSLLQTCVAKPLA